MQSAFRSDADPKQDTPLHRACADADVELVNQLIANGVNLRELNKESELPIFSAIRSLPLSRARSVLIINALLTAGGRANTRNLKLETPLHLVKQLEQQHEGDSELAELLAQVTDLLMSFGAIPLRPRLPHEW